MELQLNLFQVGGAGAMLFVLGRFLTERVDFLRRYCIPAPVVGGIIFALLHLASHMAGIFTFGFDETLKNVFMTLFFTSVGYTACFRLLKRGGYKVILFLGVSIVMVFLQNILAAGLGQILLDDSLLGMATGSIPMIGGHGTAGSIGSDLETVYGVAGAGAVSIAAATYGLVAGSLLGGPLANARIKQHGLHPDESCAPLPEAHDNSEQEDTQVGGLDSTSFMNAAVLLLVAAGLGTLITAWFKSALNLTLPSYIGAMLVAAVIRNAADAGKKEIPAQALDTWGNVSLSIFLAIALMTLKLWELADLALPMMLLLAAQTVLMFFYAYFVVYRVMGRDYEAAVMTSAFCGFGMGATPNAMANMQALTKRYGPAPQAFFIVPLVGSLFIDFFNGVIISGFLNFFS